MQSLCQNSQQNNVVYNKNDTNNININTRILKKREENEADK